MAIKLMVATDQDDNIGKNNGLPWPHCQADMRRFKDKTTHNAIVMGSNTARSLGRPLKDRLNLVMSNSDLYDPKNIALGHKGFIICTDINTVLDAWTVNQSTDNPYLDLWVIGGNQIYTHWLSSGLVQEIHWNVIHGVYPADTKFDMGGYIDQNWTKMHVQTWTPGPLIAEKIYLPRQLSLPF